MTLRFYLAGKIGPQGWRDAIVPDLQYQCSRLYTAKKPEWPELPQAIQPGGHSYVGPYFLACDHGCFHGDTQHGVGAANGGESAAIAYSRSEVWQRCQQALARATVIFAWIDGMDCYGTLLELGYAAALGKGIWIAGPRRYPELWLTYETAHRTCFRHTNPNTALVALLTQGVNAR